MAYPASAFQAQPAPQSGTATPQAIRFLRLPAVQERTGLSRSQIYRLEAAGKFPARVKLSELCSAWVESEINHWAAQRVAASRTAAA